MNGGLWQIAHTKQEAIFQWKNGFGYDSRKEAVTALNSPEIDSYYRNKLTVFKIKKVRA